MPDRTSLGVHVNASAGLTACNHGVSWRCVGKYFRHHAARLGQLRHATHHGALAVVSLVRWNIHRVPLPGRRLSFVKSAEPVMEDWLPEGPRVPCSGVFLSLGHLMAVVG
eukprot:scaffold376471_cov32-Prasinocladus_malaysianus.AAC.1